MARHLHLHFHDYGTSEGARKGAQTKGQGHPDEYAYHSTKASNLASIKKSGLQPQRWERKPGVPIRAWNKKDYNVVRGDHPEGRLYFANDPNVITQGGYGGALLRVHKSNVPTERLTSYGNTPEAQNNWFVRKSVKPEHIERLHKGQWKPL